MSLSSHLVETPEDLEVKRKAWIWNKRELLKFVTQYADAADPGAVSKPTSLQNAIAADAEKAKFPVTLVRKLGNLRRRIDASDDKDGETELVTEFTDKLRSYAEKLGLGQAVQ
ncbi:hypothetical protein [Pseudophaeobacter sp. EL27]|uniref:hypothetical protein n=1 Tax=Pseudophaeobacter sp. EL27 TaxID=2107580 RepID=UPI000EFBE286|nr:hypothetical protein [Pseudophaeobacter sp. EL27]